MGDFLQTTPLLYRIKRKYPEARLSVLVDAKCVEIASGVSLIDEIIPFDIGSVYQKINNDDNSIYEKYIFLDGRLKTFREKHFDLVYNINFSKIAALLVCFFPDSRIIGYRLKPSTHELLMPGWAGFMLQLMRDRKLMRINLVDLLAGYESLNPHSGLSPFFNVKESQAAAAAAAADDDDDGSAGLNKGPLIGLQLGCGGDLRRWPAAFFAELAVRLIYDFKARIILFGSKAEIVLGKKFKKKLRLYDRNQALDKNLEDLTGKTNISQLAAALKRCDLLITGDTGTMHLATAVGTKALALFMGPALCHETGPYGQGHYVIQAHMPCCPCTEGKDLCRNPICRQLIKPKMVFDLISHIFKANPKNSIKYFTDRDQIFSDSRNYVQIYKSVPDNWGVKFLPLIPRTIDIGEIMALIYREVGRSLIQPEYRLEAGRILIELLDFYKDIDVDTLKNLKLVQKQLTLI